MQLQYSFEGVDCPNCAAKIERQIAKLDVVESAQMDFAQSSLRVVAKEELSVEELETQMRRIFSSVEDTAVLNRIEAPLLDEDGPRAFALPEGANMMDAERALRDAGIQLDAVDEERRIVHILPTEPWAALLQKAEEAFPGLVPYQAPAQAEDNGEDRAALAKKIDRITMIAGVVMFGIAMAMQRIFAAPQWAQMIAFGVAYILSAYPVLIATVRSIGKKDPFDENFLMTVATIGAFIIGEYMEGVLVMLLFRFGEWMQDRAVNRSRDSIRQLMALKPDHANLLSGRRVVQVDPALVRVGDRIEVRPGERVPLDGVVLSGATALDVSEMTGESAPRDIAPGDEALSGAINGGGLIEIEVRRPAADSSVMRVLNLVQESSAYKARKERIFTRFARIYTPLVCLAAVLVMVIPPLFFGQDWYTWVYRGLSFLVVSCPCALVLSIPLSFFGGVGAASKKGVLVKGGECLETLARIDTAVFDKTGTLTEGVMEVSTVQTQPGFERQQVLHLAAAAEARIGHPIAEAIVRAAGPTALPDVEDYQNIPGEGVQCAVEGHQVAVGNQRLMQRLHLTVEPVGGTVAYVAIDGKYAAALQLEDQVREKSADALKALKKLGFRKTVMLTGDNRQTAQAIAERLGVDEVRAELLPDQKVSALSEIAQGTQKGCLFVGDGVNDAPVLAAADVGVAMGDAGSDAAISAADVVLLSDDIGRLADAVTISRKTQVNVYQNIALALGIKLLAMVLIALGIGQMWMAVIADAGVAVLCVFNALRLTRGK